LKNTEKGTGMKNKGNEQAKMMELMNILDKHKAGNFNEVKERNTNTRDEKLLESSSTAESTVGSDSEIFELEKEVRLDPLEKSKTTNTQRQLSKQKTLSSKHSFELKMEENEGLTKKKLRKSNSWDIIRNDDDLDMLDKKKVLKYSSCDESKRGDNSDIVYKKKVLKYSSYEQRKSKPKVIKPSSPINKISTYEGIKIGDMSSNTNQKERKPNDQDRESIGSNDDSDANTVVLSKESGAEADESQENDTMKDPLADEDNIENVVNSPVKTRASSATSGSSAYSILPPLGKPNVMYHSNVSTKQF
jgi:hypothetical protein